MVDQPGRLQPTQVFRKESGHEQCEVADVLVNVPFPIQRLRLKKHLGFEQQVYDRIDRLALAVSDLKQLIGPGELNEQVGHVGGHIEVGPAEMFREGFLGQGAEKLTQRMSSRD
jgi:hypothetical protein